MNDIPSIYANKDIYTCKLRIAKFHATKFYRNFSHEEINAFIEKEPTILIKISFWTTFWHARKYDTFERLVCSNCAMEHFFVSGCHSI